MDSQPFEKRIVAVERRLHPLKNDTIAHRNDFNNNTAADANYAHLKLIVCITKQVER